uniref:Uncharacterized protein n=1 Tax=Chelydra serpentina TaxID=8475 RepID=A0A8C3RW77_CHESE
TPWSASAGAGSGPMAARSPSGPDGGRRALVGVALTANSFPQTPQCDAAAPRCVRWCVLRVELCAKSFPQSAQWYGRSPVCVRWCDLKVELSAKPFPQSAQRCGRSPVCMRWCLLSSDDAVSAQQCGRSPVCVRWWIFRVELCAKPLPHSLYGRSPVCVRWCILRLELCAKPLPQSAQRCGRSPVWMPTSALWVSLPRGRTASCAWIPLWAVRSPVRAALSPHSDRVLITPRIPSPAGESRGNPGVSSRLRLQVCQGWEKCHGWSHFPICP